MQQGTSVKVRDVMRHLERWAPPALQESYDNSGLLVGSSDIEVNGVLVSLDCTEAVIEEAVRCGANMIVSHHPIVFKGLKRLNGANYVERTVMAAIRNNIQLYAIHTNLDNVKDGVNLKLAEQVGCDLATLEVLRPKSDVLMQLVVYTPATEAEVLEQALFDAGAGRIGAYDECGFTVEGQGTFRPLKGSNPTLGQLGHKETVQERRLEVVVEPHNLGAVLRAMHEAHPYEEVAHGIWPLKNQLRHVGSGMLGTLEQPKSELEFLDAIKDSLGCAVVKHTKLLGREVRKVAVCGGSGSFLLADAIRAGADVFVTSDFKYHEFFDADDRIVIADVGHYESEWQTTDLIVSQLKEKFTNFAVHLAKANPNPIHYR
ncbi:MAG: Nif3-like dinuclear metal center hexameric protein [Bacteroidetes bacterium]|nr:Nif3-like dinuclear metal center hexameric protein [Bacteroidota bacterium]